MVGILGVVMKGAGRTLLVVTIAVTARVTTAAAAFVKTNIAWIIIILAVNVKEKE